MMDSFYPSHLCFHKSRNIQFHILFLALQGRGTVQSLTLCKLPMVLSNSLTSVWRGCGDCSYCNVFIYRCKHQVLV